MRVRVLAVAVAAVTLSACGIAAPFPTIDVPDPGVHHDVLLMGDSLMKQAAGGYGATTPLAELMAESGMDVTLHDFSVASAGLLSSYPGGVTPREALTANLETLAASGTEPTVIVFEYAGNNGLVEEPAYGSDEWFVAWWAEAQAMVDLAAASGAAVYWTVPPPFLDPVRLRVAYESGLFLAANPGVGRVDWWRALASVDCRTWVNNRWLDLCYADELWYASDDTIHKVRHEDQLHLSPGGSTRARSWLVAAIDEQWRAAA